MIIPLKFPLSEIVLDVDPGMQVEVREGMITVREAPKQPILMRFPAQIHDLNDWAQNR